MSGERLIRVLAKLSAASSDGETGRLCAVCADVLAVSGAGIMLMSGDTPFGSLCSSDSVSAVIEELQYTLGEGPCIAAYELNRPVLEPDLARPLDARWPAFTPPALAAGAKAVFGFPMQVGGIRLGALNAYCDRSGPLSDDQHADALVMAGVAARAVLAMQSNAPPETLAAELEEAADLRFVVHQASGMASVQLGVSVGEALVRLRAHAFANEQALAALAADVVARRVRLA